MNDIEKAIRVIKQHKCEEISLYGDEYDLAIQALEKQVPKRSIRTVIEWEPKEHTVINAVKE